MLVAFPNKYSLISVRYSYSLDPDSQNSDANIRKPSQFLLSRNYRCRRYHEYLHRAPSIMQINNFMSVLNGLVPIFAITLLSTLTPNAAQADSSSLTTGRDINDSLRYWECVISEESQAQPTRSFPFRIWSDGEGFIGENKMAWNFEVDRLIVETQQGQLNLSDIQFFEIDEADDLFTAVSHENEQLRCELNGPARQADSNAEIFDDGVNTLESFLHNNSSQQWDCNSDPALENKFAKIEFTQFGQGTVGGDSIGWFFDPEQILFLQDSLTSTVVDNFKIIASTVGYRSFKGTILGNAIECETFI